MNCLAVVTELTLQPGESEVYNFTWNQVDDFGAPVPFGDYVVRSFVDSTPSLQEGSTAIGIVENTVVATVDTEKQLYTVGEIVALAITVMNIGNDPVTLTFGSCHTFYTVETAATGTVVYESDRHTFCTFIVTMVTLNPETPNR